MGLTIYYNLSTQRKLVEYDERLAAFGGALKDAAGDRAGDIRSLICGYPAYEHLEAAGMAAHNRRPFFP